MPKQNDALKDRLAKSSELTITVIGRKSGRSISLPIWFVAEDNTLYLLPVEGSDTQWFKNVRQNPSVRIKAGSVEGAFTTTPVTDPARVKSVVEKFRGKYGPSDVKKYYSKFDVAVTAKL
jgi:deazaflavin-dependent oxidoreductase (nitroreductase family)